MSNMSKRIDLIGRKFGYLTVVAYSHTDNHIFFNCKCNCGKSTTVSKNGLLSGETKSCGCLRKNLLIAKGNKSSQKMIGKKFGRWLILKRLDNDKRGGHVFKCRCLCGVIRPVDKTRLLYNLSRSCGCYQKEIVGALRRKHGMCKTKVYQAWMSMKRRCYNKKVERYKNYGGRGIKVCAKWRNSFEAFYKHIGKPPTPKHQIDRINNDDDYKPGNVRWVTLKENCNNTRRTNKLLEYNGIKKTIKQWAKVLTISTVQLNYRLRHWPIEKALTTPTRQGVLLEYNGIKKTKKQWAEELKITNSQLIRRLKHWSLHDALTVPKRKSRKTS